MDSPSLVVIPPTPVRERLSPSPQPSPTTTNTSSVPELSPSPSTIDNERTSTETTIVTIYSMYGEDDDDPHTSWTPSESALSQDHRLSQHRFTKDLGIISVTGAGDRSYSQGTRSSSHPMISIGRDSSYYDATYMNAQRPSSGFSVADKAHEMRQSVVSDDSSVQLAYSVESRPASYIRSSTVTRDTSDLEVNDTSRKSAVSNLDRSSYVTSPHSRPASGLDTSMNRTVTHSQHYQPPAMSPSFSRRSKPSVVPGPSSLTPQTPSSYHQPQLHIPATPPTQTRELSRGSHSPDSKKSLAPSEGEDPDSFHVRNTYAMLDSCGVKGDGYEEGIERTRARIGPSRASELKANAALADGTEKTRDLTQKEIELLSSLDRYGFFVTPSHDRLILIPVTPLLKPLARTMEGSKNVPPSPSPLRAQPPLPRSAKETSRALKWNRMLEARSRDEGGNVEEWGIKQSKQRKLRERTYKGIPDCWRSAAWQVLMNQFTRTGKQRLRELAEQYREAVDKPSTYDIQIDLDVPRTITGHIMFRTRYGHGQRSLFHVLHCLSLYCEECGYCQGMGPLAATLLCYYEPERVYASLVRLHDSYSMHSIFSPGFPGLLEAIYVQERIMEQQMPVVYAAFKKHMISTTSYATKWYITLFANSVPFQTQLRLWDAFLLEGHDLFVVVAIAIVWVYKDHITSESANFESVLSLLSSFFVPEDENALLSWIEKVLADKKLRSSMQEWRATWKRLVASGEHNDALL
ncbi:RabGAP/TBC [Cristinia sonorae]|uniref:RabGAP/TBC n=1 Tax=Cristinia sonorae TaxID=1940300 RepID=A0A8K0XRM0_9AGAR|nr:RabGAP/TBC [Cristinia sonorae]